MNCKKCGNEILEGKDCCSVCGAAVAAEKRENVLAGVVGAILGAAIGAGSIIGLSQLGYIASVSGLILAVCTLKGYELLAGKLSRKGIVISVVFLLLMPYVADRMDWAIVIMGAWAEYGVTFGEAFAAVPELLADGSIEIGEYIKNLLMIYGFVLLGAFSTLKNALKK